MSLDWRKTLVLPCPLPFRMNGGSNGNGLPAISVPDGIHGIHDQEQFAFILITHSFEELSTGILYCPTEILTLWLPEKSLLQRLHIVVHDCHLLSITQHTSTPAEYPDHRGRVIRLLSFVYLRLKPARESAKSPRTPPLTPAKVASNRHYC